jgi:hypothetical protein
MAFMSFIFDVGDQTVWSPALRVGELYVRFMNELGEVFETSNGLNAMAADYYYIEPDAFQAFVNGVFVDNFRNTHAIGRAMIESVLAPSAVILDRIDRPLVARTEEESVFLSKARALSMPQ